MARRLTDPHWKPPLWPVQPGNTDLGALWKDLLILHPLWEGGCPPRDWAGKADGSFPSTPPTWNHLREGIGLSFDEVNDYYEIADTNLLTLSGAWTFAFYLKVSENSGTSFQYFYSWGNFNVTNSINIYVVEDSTTETGIDLRGGVKIVTKDTISGAHAVASTRIFPSPDPVLVQIRYTGPANNNMQVFADGIDVTNAAGFSNATGVKRS